MCRLGPPYECLMCFKLGRVSFEIIENAQGSFFHQVLFFPFFTVFVPWKYCFSYIYMYCRCKVLYLSPRIQRDTKTVDLVVIYLWIFLGTFQTHFSCRFFQVSRAVS